MTESGDCVVHDDADLSLRKCDSIRGNPVNINTSTSWFLDGHASIRMLTMTTYHYAARSGPVMTESGGCMIRDD